MFGGWHMKKFHEKNYNKKWMDDAEKQMEEPDMGEKKSQFTVPVEKLDTHGKVKFD